MNTFNVKTDGELIPVTADGFTVVSNWMAASSVTFFNYVDCIGDKDNVKTVAYFSKFDYVIMTSS